MDNNVNSNKKVDYSNVILTISNTGDYTLPQDGYVVCFDWSSSNTDYRLKINDNPVGASKGASSAGYFTMFCGFAYKGDVITNSHSGNSCVVYGVK